MKPRIKLDPTRPGTGKWWCFSTHFFGGDHLREGKGYSPQAAYDKWLRCGSVRQVAALPLSQATPNLPTTQE